MVVKPTEHLNWNPSNSNSIKPVQTVLENGYPEKGEYPTENHTWLMRTTDMWNKYLEYITDQHTKQLTALNAKISGLENQISEIRRDYATTSSVNTKLNNYVSKTFSINGHSLQRNFSLTHSDVGAAPTVHNHDSVYSRKDGTTVFPKLRLKVGGSYKELKGER